MCMMNTYGCAENFKYEQYSGKNPELDFTLDYISGWTASEQSGSKSNFSQVVFYPPRGQAPNTVMSVTVENAEEVGIKPASIDARAQDILNRRLKFEESRVIKNDKVTFKSLPASEILLSYKSPGTLWSLEQKLINVTEKIIVFKRNEKFYTLRYESKSEDFDKSSKAFEHLADSLKFKANQ